MENEIERLCSNDLELLIFKGIYVNEKFRVDIFNNFEDKFFDDPHARKAFKIIKEHYLEFKKMPSKNELFYLVNEDDQEGVRLFLKEMVKAQISSYDWLGKQAGGYLKEKAVKSAIIESIEMVEHDPDKAVQHILDSTSGVSLNGYNKKFTITFPYNGESFRHRDDIKDKKYWIYPLLPKGGHLSLWAGSKGCGKSMLAMKLADTAAKNDNFYVWKGYDRDECCPSAAKILYLDGEMSPQEMKLRIEMFDMNDNFTPYQFRDINNVDKRATLSDKDYRDFLLERIVEEKFQVVIIDNVVSLFVGLDENSAKDWSPVNQWLLDLRMNNVSVILIHHMGKDDRSGARGTAHRYDNVDDTIYLTKPKNHDQSDGIKFWMKFEHFRSYVPYEERDLLIGKKLISFKEGQWEFGDKDEDGKPSVVFSAMKILIEVDANIRTLDLRDRIGVGKNHQIINELCDLGYVSIGGATAGNIRHNRVVTPLGHEWYQSEKRKKEMVEEE